MWIGFTTFEYVIIIMWTPWINWECSFYLLYIQVDLGNLGGVILPALCTWILFTPWISQETLFIPVRFHEITLRNNTIIENTNILHNILTIQTSTIHYSYQRQFLPMKGRQWRPMLDATNRMKHNHAVE